MQGAQVLDVEHFRQRLLARRDELSAESRAGADDRAPPDLDQQQIGRLSRVDAIQQQEMALEVERRRRVEQQRIEAALARLKAGEYGECLHCGEPIARARLELDPAATLCIACARGDDAA